MMISYLTKLVIVSITLNMVSVCCLTRNQQFCSNIMARTS